MRLLLPLLALACGAPTPPSPPTASSSRGILSESGGGLTFTPCGGAATPVTDRTGGPLTAARQAIAGDGPGDRFLVGVVSDGAIQKVTRLQALGGGDHCAAPEPRLRAAGNEPFWSLTLDAGSDTLRYATPDGGFDLPWTTPPAGGDGLEWTGSANGHTIALTLRSGGCQDTMAPFWYAWRAEARIDGVTQTGCATWTGPTTP